MALYTKETLEYTFLPVQTFRKCFRIKTPSDAHICLTSAPFFTPTAIEILLGEWGNSKSTIRLSKADFKKGDVVDQVEAETPDLFSASEFRNFAVEWTTQGKVQVYLEQATEPFLSWTNPEPFVVTHFGIQTCFGSDGEWFVDGSLRIETVDTDEYIFHPIEPTGGRIDFEVQAISNAHLCLTTGPADDLPIHEIMLGGWENSKSIIRHNKEKPDMAGAPTPNLLSPQEFKSFWIQWDYFSVSAGQGGEALPFMRWEGRIPHEVNYFGIRTYWGADGYWKFPGTQIVGDVTPNANVVVQSGEEVLREKRAEPVEGISWVPAAGGELPDGAFVGGFDSGFDLYVARANHEGEIIPGKLIPAHGVAYVPWGGKENAKDQYEVLVVDPSTVSWVPSSGGQIPPNAVPGGLSSGGETLYIGRGPHEGTTTNGKIHPSHGSLYICYGGVEIGYPQYEILVRN